MSGRWARSPSGRRSCPAVARPVALAGGIATASGVAAAIGAGAGGVSVGTRFLASDESDAHERYKQAVVDADEMATVVTPACSGKPSRALRNPFTEAWVGREADIQPYPAQAISEFWRARAGAVEGDLQHGFLPMGQCASRRGDAARAGDRRSAGGCAEAMSVSLPPASFPSGRDGVRAWRDGRRTRSASRRNRQITYRSLVERIDRVASAATGGLGLRQGDQAAIMASNCIEFIEIVPGARIGGIATAMVNARFERVELAYVCNDAEARTLFVSPKVAERARDARRPGHGRAGDRDRPRVRDASRRCTSRSSRRERGGVGHVLRSLHGWDDWRAEGGHAPAPIPDPHVLRDGRGIRLLRPPRPGAGDRSDVPRRGLRLLAARRSCFGGFCAIHDHFDPERVLDDLDALAITNIFLVPTHFSAIFTLDDRVLARHEHAHLRTIISNAAPLPQVMKERIVAEFGEGVLFEAYGSTEAAIVSNLRPPDQLRKERCVGQPFPCTEVRLVGDDGSAVPDGEVGELFIARRTSSTATTSDRTTPRPRSRTAG